MRSTSCGFSDNQNVKGRDLLVLSGPTLVVDIGFDPLYVPSGQPGYKGAPDLAMKGVHALVDTGATQSCIDSQLAIALGLPVVDQAKVAGIGGEKTVNMHLAQIHVPSLPHTIYGSFAAVDLAAGGQTHYALIGRTFLRPFKMEYDGTTGEVVIYEPQSTLEIPTI